MAGSETNGSEQRKQHTNGTKPNSEKVGPPPGGNRPVRPEPAPEQVLDENSDEFRAMLRRAFEGAGLDGDACLAEYAALGAKRLNGRALH